MFSALTRTEQLTINLACFCSWFMDTVYVFGLPVTRKVKTQILLQGFRQTSHVISVAVTQGVEA